MAASSTANMADNYTWSEFMRQLPAILASTTALVVAVGAAWANLRGRITTLQNTANLTHGLINSRFDEWKAETLRAATAAAVQAASAASLATTLAYKEGMAHGKVERERERASRLET